MIVVVNLSEWDVFEGVVGLQYSNRYGNHSNSVIGHTLTVLQSGDD